MYIHTAEYFIIEAKAERKEISQELKKYISEMPRPANRFTLIALAGVLKCLQEQKAKSDTAVYLATEFGNIENTYKCISEVHINKELPMPFTFLNTLNNMAGFHIAKILGLTSRSFTVSSKGVSFEKALQLAKLSLAKEPQASVLVGGTDSAFAEFYVEKPPMLPADTLLKEGSAWLYINGNKAQAIGQVKEIKSFSDHTALEQWLRAYDSSENVSLAFNVHVDKKEKDTIRAIRPELKEYAYLSKLGYFGTVVGAGLVQFLKDGKRGTLLHISKNRYDSYMLIELVSF